MRPTKPTVQSLKTEKKPNPHRTPTLRVDTRDSTKTRGNRDVIFSTAWNRRRSRCTSLHQVIGIIVFADTRANTVFTHIKSIRELDHRSQPGTQTTTENLHQQQYRGVKDSVVSTPPPRFWRESIDLVSKSRRRQPSPHTNRHQTPCYSSSTPKETMKAGDHRRRNGTAPESYAGHPPNRRCDTGT